MNRIGALRKISEFFFDSALEQNLEDQIPERHYFDRINWYKPSNKQVLELENQDFCK